MRKGSKMNLAKVLGKVRRTIQYGNFPNAGLWLGEEKKISRSFQEPAADRLRGD